MVGGQNKKTVVVKSVVAAVDTAIGLGTNKIVAVKNVVVKGGCD